MKVFDVTYVNVLREIFSALHQQDDVLAELEGRVEADAMFGADKKRQNSVLLLAEALDELYESVAVEVFAEVPADAHL